MHTCTQCQSSYSTNTEYITHLDQCVFPLIQSLKHKCSDMEDQVYKIRTTHHYDILQLKDAYEKAQSQTQQHYQTALEYQKKLSKQDAYEAQFALFKRLHTQQHQQELKKLTEQYEKQLHDLKEESVLHLQKVHGECGSIQKRQHQHIQTLSEELKSTQQTVRELVIERNAMSKENENKERTWIDTQNYQESRLKEQVQLLKQFREQEETLKREIRTAQQYIQTLKEQLALQKEETDTNMQTFQKNLMRETTEYKRKLQEQCDQLVKDNQKHCSVIQRMTVEINELKEKTVEMDKVRNTLTATQQSLKEYMNKCKEMEKQNKTPSRKTIHFSQNSKKQ